MKKVAVVTATRAEYGILRPLLYKLKNDSILELQLLVTGTHLSEEYGYTIKEIIQDGFKIQRKIPILQEGNTPYDISVTMGNAIIRFAAYFQEERPDMLVVLGDRTEMLAICSAAMNARIPIAHIHGGETTEGAVDECVRHAITKMSYLHFASTETYRKRIIQMGEAPDRVFNVGAMGVENILKTPLKSLKEIREELEIPEKKEYIVMTFHPVTLEGGAEAIQTNELIQAMREKPEYFYLVTKANADAGGRIVNQIMETYACGVDNVKVVSSLGMVCYLSALKYCKFEMGNSSSGIIEAPALGIASVNIGNRQKGRLQAESVINCDTTTSSIVKAMETAAKMRCTPSYLYGDGTTSEKILSVIKNFLLEKEIKLEKSFYDLA